MVGSKFAGHIIYYIILHYTIFYHNIMLKPFWEYTRKWEYRPTKGVPNQLGNAVDFRPQFPGISTGNSASLEIRYFSKSIEVIALNDLHWRGLNMMLYTHSLYLICDFFLNCNHVDTNQQRLLLILSIFQLKIVYSE